MRIILLLSILYSTNLSAQFFENTYQKANLYLKNGDSISGLAKIDKDNRLYFKETKKAKKIRYDSKKVKSLKMFKDGNIKTFIYKLLVSEGPILLRIENGEHLKMQLYSQSFFFEDGFAGGFTNGVYNPGFSTGKTAELKRYYINKKNSNLSVIKIWSETNGRKNKEFRKRILKYFKNCEELIDRIKNENYNRYQIKEIVDFYNYKC